MILDKLLAVGTGGAAVLYAQNSALPNMSVLEKSVLGGVVIVLVYLLFALWRHHKETVKTKDEEIKRLNEKILDEVKRIADR